MGRIRHDHAITVLQIGAPRVLAKVSRRSPSISGRTDYSRMNYE